MWPYAVYVGLTFRFYQTCALCANVTVRQEPWNAVLVWWHPEFWWHWSFWLNIGSDTHTTRSTAAFKQPRGDTVHFTSRRRNTTHVLWPSVIIVLFTPSFPSSLHDTLSEVPFNVTTHSPLLINQCLWERTFKLSIMILCQLLNSGALQRGLGLWLTLHIAVRDTGRLWNQSVPSSSLTLPWLWLFRQQMKLCAKSNFQSSSLVTASQAHKDASYLRQTLATDYVIHWGRDTLKNKCYLRRVWFTHLHSNSSVHAGSGFKFPVNSHQRQ